MLVLIYWNNQCRHGNGSTLRQVLVTRKGPLHLTFHFVLRKDIKGKKLVYFFISTNIGTAGAMKSNKLYKYALVNHFSLVSPTQDILLILIHLFLYRSRWKWPPTKPSMRHDCGLLCGFKISDYTDTIRTGWDKKG